MTTIEDVLKGLTQYPLPSETLKSVAARRGYNLSDEATKEDITSREFLLAEADLYAWLSIAPNVSQGGQSYSFTAEQQTLFKKRADSIYKALGEKDIFITDNKPNYGYKGSKL